MSSTRTYAWKDGDQLWYLSARFLSESGYASVSQLAEAIRTANPQILSWASADIAAGALITIPYLDS